MNPRLNVSNPYQKQIDLAKSYGYSDQEINSFMTQSGLLKPAAPVQSTPTGQRGRGGTLTSLISEGGALGGAAVGASIGSVVPVLGTAIGGAIGAGLGAFGGRLAENKIRDNRLGVGDAAKEGAISAVLSAPLKLGKYGVTAGKAIKGGSTLEKALASGATAAEKFSLRAAAGSKATKVSEDLIAKQFRLNPTQQFNFSKKHGEEAVSVLKRYGLNSSDEVLTKGIEPLQNAFDGVISEIPSISKKSVQKALKSAYKPLIDSPVMVEKQLGQQLKSQADELLTVFPNTNFIASSGGEIAGEISQDQAKKRLAAVERQIATSQTKGGVSGDTLRSLVREKSTLETALQAGITRTNDKLPATALNEIRRKFDNAVNYTLKGAPEDTVVKKSADSLRKVLQTEADKVGIKVNGKSFKDIGKDLSKLRDIQEIVGKQEYLGTGNLPFNIPAGLGSGVGATIAGGPGGALGMAGAPLINSKAGRRGIVKGTEALGAKLSNSAANSTGMREALAGGARGALGASLIQNLTGQSLGSNTQPITEIPSITNIQNIPNSYSQLDQVSSGNMDNSPFAPQNIQEALMTIAQNGGTNKDITEFLNIAKTYQSLLPKEATAKAPNATQLQQANNAISGLNDLQAIRQTLQSNPNVTKLNSLPGGNLTRGLTGTSGYEASRQNVADVIGRLRSGGAINSDEEKRFLSLLPGSFDSPQIAEQKLSRLEELFLSFANPVGSASTIEDALAQYQ